jgi:preprotein translocase subunit YajC
MLHPTLLATWLALQGGAQAPVTTGAPGAAPGNAPANPPASSGGSPLNMLILMVLIGGVFYFLMIGPDRKARKKREAMLGAMKKGDRVMTSSGIYGSVAAIQEDVVTLQVADGVRMRFSRAAIQTILEDEAAETADKDGVKKG